MAWTFDNLSGLLGRLERLQLFEVVIGDNRTSRLLLKLHALKSHAIKYSPACAVVNPLVATRSVISRPLSTIEELEFNAKEGVYKVWSWNDSVERGGPNVAMVLHTFYAKPG